MADEAKPTQVTLPNLKVVKREGGACNIYANYVHLAWTGFDVAIRFYRYVQPITEIQPDVPHILEEQGSVTLAWAEAKALQKVLNEALTRYEKANGEIKDFVAL